MIKDNISLETALERVSQRGCKGTHYDNVAVTDAMVEKICAVKSLVNVGFNNTDITDKSLQYLATLPKLTLLFLENNPQMTGTGFSHFSHHNKLRSLDISGTGVNDATLKLIVQIPKLCSIKMFNTQVTFDGLLAVAHCHWIKFHVGDSFSDEQIAQFQHRQRNSQKKKSKSVNPDDLIHAQTVLSNFFKDYNEWEVFATNLEDDERLFQKITPKLKKIYQRYITETNQFNCQGFSHAKMVDGTCVGTTFSAVKFLDSEFIIKNKMNIYAEISSVLKQSYRFLMVKQGDTWKIDKIQWHYDGRWQKTYHI